MALVAMVREQFVSKDKVIDDEVIAEGITIASLLPGPVAVNVVAYTAYTLGGVRAALISVVAVLIPSLVLVTAFAALYFSVGEYIGIEGVLKGIMPVIVALLLSVAATMGIKSVSGRLDGLLLIFATVGFILLPRYEIVLGVFLISGFMGILFRKPVVSPIEEAKPGGAAQLVIVALLLLVACFSVRYFFYDYKMARLVTEFASISLSLFGGGYVMVPMLKGILVEQTQWFSLDEFMAGISVGQITPGPILISAAFFGYKLNGVIGAILATVAIFFPSSLVMIIVSKFFVQFKSNPWVQGALAGIKPAIVGLILAAAISIYWDYWYTTKPVLTLGILIISFLLFFRFKINPAIVVVASGGIGYIAYSV